ncbi:MAG: hypothetical protein R2795_14130 [Saprospiraceae bacterium]
MGLPCVALAIGKADKPRQLGQYGASKVGTSPRRRSLDSQVYATAIAEAARQEMPQSSF